MVQNLEEELDSVFSPVKAFGHRKVRDYLNGNHMIYPVTYELGPAGPGNCNNKCNFCMHGAYYSDKAFMPSGTYARLLKEIKELSNGESTGMIYSASGEPLTNPEVITFMELTKQEGIDQALITNGTALIKRGMIEAILKNIAWTRISLDAGTSETRKKIHGVNDFNQVLNSLEELAIKKRESRSITNIGSQIVVSPENYQEIIEATRRVAKTGIDYFQIKPVVYHPADGKPQEPRDFWEKVMQFAISARDLYNRKEESSRFDVFIKFDQFGAIMKPDHDKGAYKACKAIFFPIIEATGDVYHCSQTRGMPDFKLGNINEQSFKEIWNSEKRKEVIENINVEKCQPVCRCHWMNKMLTIALEGKHAPSFI